MLIFFAIIFIIFSFWVFKEIVEIRKHNKIIKNFDKIQKDFKIGNTENYEKYKKVVNGRNIYYFTDEIFTDDMYMLKE